LATKNAQAMGLQLEIVHSRKEEGSWSANKS
jgi:hypothetical protein